MRGLDGGKLLWPHKNQEGQKEAKLRPTRKFPTIRKGRGGEICEDICVRKQHVTPFPQTTVDHCGPRRGPKKEKISFGTSAYRKATGGKVVLKKKF